MRIPTVAERQAVVRPRRYDPPHVLWYFGGIMAALTAVAAVGAVTASDRGVWRLLLALAFIAVLAGLAALLLARGWWVPAGILATAAVVVVPAAVQAFERLIGVWPERGGSFGSGPAVLGVSVSGSGIVQEFEPAVLVLPLATIVAGLAVHSIVRFPFAFATVTAAAIAAVQLLLPALVDEPSANERMTALIVTGGMLFLAAVVLDSVQRREDAFWWHVAGLFAIALGLLWYAVPRGEEWAWIAILLVAGSLLLLSAPFERAVWASFGVAGVFAALAHYLGDWFGGWREPALLAFASVGLVGLGIALQLYERLWERLTGRLEPVAAPATAPPPPPPPSTELVPEPPTEEPPPEEPPPDGPTRPA